MDETTAVTAASVGDLATLVPSWVRSLRAANKSAKTISQDVERRRRSHGARWSEMASPHGSGRGPFVEFLDPR